MMSSNTSNGNQERRRQSRNKIARNIDVFKAKRLIDAIIGYQGQGIESHIFDIRELVSTHQVDLKKPVEVNSECGWYLPLNLACDLGPYIQNNPARQPLSNDRYKRLLALLVELGAPINGIAPAKYWGGDFWSTGGLTPLMTVLFSLGDSRCKFNFRGSGYGTSRDDEEGDLRRDIATFLMGLGASPVTSNSRGVAPIHIAAGMGDVKSIRALIEHAKAKGGIDVNRPIRGGRSLKGLCPIHLLMTLRLRTDTRSRYSSEDDSNSVSRWSIKKLKSRRDALIVLKRSGLKFNRLDGDKNNAIHHLVFSFLQYERYAFTSLGVYDMLSKLVEYLVSNGSNINAVGGKMMGNLTPLLYALKVKSRSSLRNLTYLVSILLEHGASTQKKVGGKTAFDYVRNFPASDTRSGLRKLIYSTARPAARVELGRRLGDDVVQKILFMARLTDVNATTPNPSTQNLRRAEKKRDRKGAREYIREYAKQRRRQ
jgi:ankyrin repeat protein